MQPTWVQSLTPYSLPRIATSAVPGSKSWALVGVVGHMQGKLTHSISLALAIRRLHELGNQTWDSSHIAPSGSGGAPKWCSGGANLSEVGQTDEYEVPRIFFCLDPVVPGTTRATCKLSGALRAPDSSVVLSQVLLKIEPLYHLPGPLDYFSLVLNLVKKHLYIVVFVWNQWSNPGPHARHPIYH